MNTRIAHLPADASRARSGSSLARFEATLVAAWDRFLARQEYRRSLEQLRDLDAELLKDIGVTSDEVEHLIRKSQTRWLI